MDGLLVPVKDAPALARAMALAEFDERIVICRTMAVYRELLGIIARLVLPGWSLGQLMLCLAAFAAASELLQFWVPGRTPSLSDFAQDTLGAALGVLVSLVVRLKPL